MMLTRAALATAVVFCGCLLPIAAIAADTSFGFTTTWPGFLALAIFIIAYVLVVLEEHIDLSKSKPVVLAAGLIWLIIAAYVQFSGADAQVEEALTESLIEFSSLFLFLLVAMTYVNAMIERDVFNALRSWLATHGFSYKKLFWITGFLAFLLSPAIDNLTTTLVMAAVVLAVGAGNARFITLSCINIVIGANAGGAFSPFGDITTLMVWQAHKLGFAEFFLLIIPALVNFVVPAALMYFAIPDGAPEAGTEKIQIKRGGWAVIVLFACTVATAVLGHGMLGLPPYFGMMLGLAYLQFLMYYLLKTTLTKDRALETHRQSGTPIPPVLKQHEKTGESVSNFSVFKHVADAEWDTLLFFYGVLLCIGGLAFIGYLTVLADVIYLQWGATWANITVGVLSAIVDNIPIMAAVIKMDPSMPDGQWLLVTLTAGVGGSLLSIGSAAGVALMGQARGFYTFMSHLKWSWAIALGYVASVIAHMLINSGTF